MRLLLVTVFISAAILCIAAERRSYKGYQVFDVVPKTKEQVEFLRDLLFNNVDLKLDFWVEPSYPGKTVTIMVSPKQFRRFQILLRKQGLDLERNNPDLHKVMEPMWADIDKRMQAGMVFDINNYNTLADINSYLTSTAASCAASGLTCRVYSIGNSIEGRPLNVFHISSGSGRRGYWIDATIHAREWIAPATVLYTLDTLVRRATPEAVALTDEFDWYILPVMNPDGYEFTWTNDRLWRKNRRQSGAGCIGVDLNRNFNFRWGTEGVSHSPCSDTFCGASGGSEPETQAVSAEINRLGPSLQATVTVHAYGQMWMFPWGNTVNHEGNVCDRADDHAELMAVADPIADAIEDTHGTQWARGNSCEVIYETTGGTDDYAKGVSNVKYAFCPELRGNSFVIPPSNIPLSHAEFWNGIVAMANAIP